MTQSKKPVVTVVHSLPGRVRARLSVAPGDVQRMLAGVREHPGMDSISFSPITRSILARFNRQAADGAPGGVTHDAISSNQVPMRSRFPRAATTSHRHTIKPRRVAA